MEELVLILERHVAGLVVFIGKLLYLLLQVLHLSVDESLQLLYDRALLLQILLLFVALVGSCSVACLKEFVACSQEVIPQLIAYLAWYHADSLPFLLQLYQLVGSLFPLSAVL